MGCWNETCGISQLPILGGDKVKLVVLVGGNSDFILGSGTSYINEIWSPISIPISGEYNEYGSLTEDSIVEDEASAMLFDSIKRYWTQSTHEEWLSYVGNNNENPDLNLFEAIKYIERGKVTRKGYKGNEEKLSLFFILEDVYNACISYNPVVADFYKNAYYYRHYHEAMTKDIHRFYDSLQEVKNSNPTALMVNTIFAESQYITPISTTYNFKDKIIDLIKNNVTKEDPKFKKLVSMIIDYCSLVNSMSSARKMWQPQTGKGSQNNALDVYKLINKSMNKLMSIRSKEQNTKRDKEGYSKWERKHNKEVDSKNEKL
jgi:hypothetical protein